MNPSKNQYIFSLIMTALRDVPEWGEPANKLWLEGELLRIIQEESQLQDEQPDEQPSKLRVLGDGN